MKQIKFRSGCVFFAKGIYSPPSFQLVIIPTVMIKNYKYCHEDDGKGLTHRTVGIMFEWLCFYIEVYAEWNQE